MGNLPTLQKCFLNLLEVFLFWYPFEKGVLFLQDVISSVFNLLLSVRSVCVLQFLWTSLKLGSLSLTFEQHTHVFLVHLSMLQRKWNLSCLWTVSVDACVCSWIFYCWSKLCNNELQFLQASSDVEKLNPRCLLLKTGLIFFIVCVCDDFADWS